MESIHYENILDNFEFLVWLKDADGFFLDVNDKFVSATGLNNINLIIGKTDFDIWPYELALKYQKDDQLVMKSKVSKKVIEEVFDHERKWFETFKKPLLNSFGHVVGTFGYSIDLSEKINFQKQLEDLNEKLSFESLKLKTLINAIPDLVWLKDINGSYVTCNKRFEELYGYSKDEIVGKTDYDFVDKHTADFFREHDTIALNSSKPASNFELLKFANDGHTEYTKTIKTKVIDNDENIIGILGIGRDFTAEKEANENLEFQKRELQTIFDTAKDGIAILDLETNFKKVNKAYCDITGLSENELLQTSCFALTLPEDLETTISKMKMLTEKGFVDNYEKRCVINNKLITVSLAVTLLPDKESMLITMKDITKFKLFEEQSKLASMGEMIGNIAHQWRQPLSVISALASGIQFRNDYNQLADYNINDAMDDIMKQTEYLSKTIDDFRNFIKDAHEQKYISVQQTIEKTISIIHPAMKSNNIRLVVDCDFDVEILGYENELIQSFINIINNARDAIKENISNDSDRFIFIKTIKLDNGLRLAIKDSGGGIPNNVIDKIFEPYFTTKHQSIGTGIGLSMTYKIITEHHDASITVQNEEYQYENKSYKGACFEIIFYLDGK